ncbi:MAG: hypothetical protein ABH849_02520 [Nanoarchaeota archaeon]
MARNLVRLAQNSSDGSGYLKLVIDSTGEDAIGPRLVKNGIRVLRGSPYGKHLERVIDRNAPENANAYLNAGLSSHMETGHSQDGTHLMADCFVLYYSIDWEQAMRLRSSKSSSHSRLDVSL